MTAVQPKRPMFMYILGIIIVTGVAAFALFSAADRLFLTSYTADAVVEKKEYRPPGKSYSTQVIGGRTQTIPQTTDEQYLLFLSSDRKPLCASVEKRRYDDASPGDRVSVACRKRRITGTVEVISVK